MDDFSFVVEAYILDNLVPGRRSILTKLLGDKINNQNLGFLVQLVQKSIKNFLRNPVLLGYRRKT
jgi:hypothetical protein